MEKDNRYLQLQGIVQDNVLSKLVPTKKFTKVNAKWIFVDYAPKDYEVETRFDVMLHGEAKLMIPEIFNIKLLNVLDQFGNYLDSIPAGWKTICRFEFTPSVPKEIKALPNIDYWKYNKNSLIIARHNEITVDETNIIPDDLYVDIFSDIMSVFTDLNSLKGYNLESLISKVEINQDLKNKLFSKLVKTSDINKAGVQTTK